MVNLSFDQPKSTSQIIKDGIQVWKKTFVIALPFSIMLSLLNIGIQFSTRPFHGILSETSKEFKNAPLLDWLQASGAAVYASNDFTWATLSIPIFFLVSLVMYAGMLYRINAVMQHETPEFNQALTMGFYRLLPLLGVYIVSYLAVFLGFILFVIPGLIISVYFLFSSFIVVTSEKGVFASFRESIHLVSGNFWHTTFTFLGVMVIYLIFTLCLRLLANGLSLPLSSLFESPTVIDDLKIIIQGLTYIILYPFVPACLLVLLYSLRAKKLLTGGNDNGSNKNGSSNDNGSNKEHRIEV